MTVIDIVICSLIVDSGGSRHFRKYFTDGFGSNIPYDSSQSVFSQSYLHS